jgi:hypothetical protein
MRFFPELLSFVSGMWHQLGLGQLLVPLVPVLRLMVLQLMQDMATNTGGTLAIGGERKLRHNVENELLVMAESKRFNGSVALRSVFTVTRRSYGANTRALANEPEWSCLGVRLAIAIFCLLLQILRALALVE